MRNKYVQISLPDIYNDISSAVEEQKPELFSLIDEYIDFESFISCNFHRAFLQRTWQQTYSSS